MKIAHCCLYGPFHSGLYDSTKELMLAERELGLESELIDMDDLNYLYGADDIVPKSIEYAETADIVAWHRKIPVNYWSDETKRIVMFIHGLPELAYDKSAGEEDTLIELYQETHKLNSVKSVITMWQREYEIWKSLFNPVKLHHINCWYDWKGVPANDKQFKKGKLRLVTFDKWSQTKTFFHIMCAMRILCERLPNVEISLDIFASDLWNKNASTVLSYCKELKLKNKGHVANLHNHVANYDLMLTELNQESRAVRMAISSGLPVVYGSHPPIFGDFGTSASHVDLYADEIVKAYGWLCNVDMEKYIVKSRNFASNNFDIMSATKKVVKLYEEAMK